NALTGVTWSVMLAVGGALGGLIAALVSNRAAFLADSSSFLISAALLVGFKTPLRARQREDIKETKKESGFGPALDYLRARPQVIALLLIKSGICVTAGGVWLLSIVYGQRVFPIGEGGALSVGLFYGAHGFGAIIGANFTGRFFRKAAMGPFRSILWAFLVR